MSATFSVSAVSSSGFRRRNGRLDTLLAEGNRALQVLAGAAVAGRANPAGRMPPEGETLDESARRHAAGLMRVNHVGEICAQALYRGQAASCDNAATRELLYEAAQEEVDHLAWCEDRLRELGSRPSLLNPLWYAGAFGLGVLAGRAGTPRNLGFMAETERQVEEHLDSHLADAPSTAAAASSHVSRRMARQSQGLPSDDSRSRAIVSQMREDEIGHRQTAEQAGAHVLPAPVKMAMRLMSRVMTGTAYWV